MAASALRADSTLSPTLSDNDTDDNMFDGATLSLVP